MILPEDLDFPNTMTDIDYDTWMLSGSAIMQDGSTIRNGYSLDLDTLQVQYLVFSLVLSSSTTNVSNSNKKKLMGSLILL